MYHNLFRLTSVVTAIAIILSAFGSNNDGAYEVYIMNADGSGVTRLTDNPADDEVPDWSP